MKKTRYAFLLLFLFGISINSVKADEGQLYENSIKSCNGITYGYHNNHYHKAKQTDAGFIAEGDAIYTDPCAEYNDISLKSVTINQTNIQTNDEMTFTTYDSTANIEILPNYQYAKVEYEKTKNLEIGNNKIEAKLTTPGGMTKTYTINIIRNKKLSSNNKIKTIKIDGKEYKFIDNEINNIFVTSNRKSLKINIITEDKKAKINIEGNNKLKTGNNKITIYITAENNEIQKYYINYSKSMFITDIIGMAIGILILSSPIIIAIIIFTIKNKKRNKYMNRTHYYKH